MKARSATSASLAPLASRRARALRVATSALGFALGAACSSTGPSKPPPQSAFYYPVGLSVSAEGNVLYAANSDFDLQYTGGTVQSYDLTAIRNDTIALLLGIYEGAAAFSAGTLDAGIPAVPGLLPFAGPPPSGAGCPNTCAPPMNNAAYWKDTITINPLATAIQLSPNGGRLFVPVRSDTSLTWMDVQSDDDPRYLAGAPSNATAATYPPFFLNCNRTTADACDSLHHAGQLSDPGNTRQLTMPSDPFAMAFTDDGTGIVVTHEDQTESSLYLTGLDPAGTTATPSIVEEAGSSEALGQNAFDPSIQFIVDSMPQGGVGIASVPHDLAAIPNPDPTNPLRPALLQTSNQAAEIDLLRYYSDEGVLGASDEGGTAGLGQVGSLNLRPFLIRERAYSVAGHSAASSTRGIAIDPTPRIACELNVTGPLGLSTTSPQYVACAQTPARVFIASAAPPLLVLGQIGGMGQDGTYDPDQLTISGGVSLSSGPSNVYVAPIVDQNGLYSVRVFVVCFDSQTIVIYDPDTQRIENEVSTGPGPFAMAFDPFDVAAVAAHAAVPFDPRSKYMTISNGSVTGPALRAYRFAYIASFTDSFVQVMDLDQSFKDDRLGAGTATFENIVYSLGVPSQPVGPS